MDISVEESLLSAFPCPDWFGLALAASLAWALSTAWGDSRVMVTFRSKVFFPVTAEELGAMVVEVVVVTTAIKKAELDAVAVCHGRGRNTCPARASPGHVSVRIRPYKSLEPFGGTLRELPGVPGIPPIPSRVDGGNAGNAALSTWGAAGVTLGFNGLEGGTDRRVTLNRPILLELCHRQCPTTTFVAVGHLGIRPSHHFRGVERIPHAE